VAGDGYRIDIAPHGKGLRARIAGEADVEATQAYWRQIAKAARERDADSLLLVDELAGRPLDESDWLSVVTSLRGEGLERLRIAHVKPLGLQQVEFCEIFARDAGIEARVFENETLADIWLRYGERPLP
jgi:hypothetical protein